jgi:cytochrome P450
MATLQPAEPIAQRIIAPNLASPKFKANPYQFYARLRAEAPFYRTTLPDGQAAWLVSRYEDVLMVLKDERFAKDRFNIMTPEQRTKMPWMPGMLKPLAHNMLDQDGADHTRLRTLVHKAFTPRLIERLRERIQAVCDGLIDAAQPNGRVDLIREYALPLPVTIISELLGVPPQDRHKFQAWSKRIVSSSSSGDLLLALPSIWLFIRYLRRLFELRRADPQDDLITALVQAEEAGDALSEDELLGMAFLLLVAGHETTVNLIGSGTLALLQHPEQLDLLRRDPTLIKPAIEELLRYTSPVDIATERYAREDMTIGEVTIPRGEQVLAVLGSANRDERQFMRPDALDITREPNKHLAFGHGVHFCLGAPLARLEGQIAVSTLLQRMPNLRLTGAPEALRWRKGVFLRGLEQLPLAFS